jgi:hypothetical protein
MVVDIRQSDNEEQNEGGGAVAAARRNGMNEYEQNTNEWNRSNEIAERRYERAVAINNTNGYRTGNRIHHLRAIQMYNYDDWNALFGNITNLDPLLREYAQASIDYVDDETGTLLFAGQMEVSLMTQENYRPGVHVFTFFIHLTPHRGFYDGHMIQMEVGEGSQRHRTINRLFDTNTRAIVLQATEYQLLEFLAVDDEAMELLHGSFLDNELQTMRLSYVDVAPENRPAEDGEHGEYQVNPYAIDEHEWHVCAEEYVADAIVAADVAIPPPPPVNDFAAIYQRYYDAYDRNEEDAEMNIIRYNEYNHDDFNHVPQRG